MSENLVIALVTPWGFWGILIGLLIAAGRSWINMLLIPAGITVVILVIASLVSVQEAFWASLILHLFLLVFFLWSYVSFLLSQRKKKR
ncbi:MAG: hypothetical protein QM484_09795 [Woeseiaceae bacterium]